MKDRTTLALEACQGLSDKELAQRGPAGFSKMIERKRKYAAVARLLDKVAKDQLKEIDKLKLQIKILTTQVETMTSLDAPVTDTSEASSMLAAFAAKKGG